MYFSGFVDLSSGTNQSANNLNTQGVQAYVIGNESPYTLVASAKGTGVSKSIYPGTVDYIDILAGFSGSIDFAVTAKLSGTATWPSFFLQLDAVGVQDNLNRGAYPVPLPRQVNIGGTVNTSSINALSNEGTAPTVLVIDIGDSNFSQLLTINNDGSCVWSVDQSNVKHQVIKINTSLTPLQLGQSGDITEILGNLTVDGTETVTGNVTQNGTLTTNGAASLKAGLTSTGGAQTITGNGNGTLHLGTVATGDVIDTTSASGSYDTFLKAGNILHIQIPSGTDVWRFDGVGKLGVSASGDTLDAGFSNATYLKTRSTTSGTIHFQPISGTDVATVINGSGGGVAIAQANTQGFTWFNNNFLPEISFFTGTGSGTYNHTFNGSGESITPFWFAPIVSQAGSATQGYDSATSSQVHITLGAALSFKCFCG